MSGDSDTAIHRLVLSQIAFVIVLGIVIQPSFAQSRCDFNGDNICDVSDIDMLTVEVVEQRGQAPSFAEFDVSMDGVMDLKDRDEWLTLAAFANGFDEPYLLGDGNLDGNADVTDLMMVGINWLRRYEPVGFRWGWGWGGADYNMDGFTNAVDLNALAKNWQRSIQPSDKAVPEPMSCLLISFVAGVSTIEFRRWKRARR